MLAVSRRGAVAELTLARPPVNAIDDAMIAALHRALDELAAQPDAQVLHFRSEGKVFAAGADLALIQSWKDAPSPGGALSAYIDRLQGLYHRIESLPQVTLCEIAGAAMGGGYELALACDLRIAAEEAKIGLPEVGIGLIPGAGGTQRLTRLCGRGVAARVILMAEPVDGRDGGSARHGRVGGAARGDRRARACHCGSPRRHAGACATCREAVHPRFRRHRRPPASSSSATSAAPCSTRRVRSN